MGHDGGHYAGIFRERSGVSDVGFDECIGWHGTSADWTGSGKQAAYRYAQRVVGQAVLARMPAPGCALFLLFVIAMLYSYIIIIK
jgi:hypothetical protein